MAKRNVEGFEYYARRPFDYDEESFDHGQVIELTGQRNDEKLLRLGYVAEIPGSVHSLSECGPCGGKKFIGAGERDAHGKQRHSDRFAGLSDVDRAAAEEEAADKLEKRLERVAPIHFDRTKASIDAGEGAAVVTTKEPGPSAPGGGAGKPEGSRPRQLRGGGAKKKAAKSPRRGQASRRAARS